VAFDPKIHQIKIMIIRCGQLLDPDEKNITKLYEETSRKLGVPLIATSTAETDHLPTPEESARENPDNPHVQVCPKCGEKSYFMLGLCRTCKDAEGGKYKTMFECYKCHHKEKSEEPVVVWLERLGIDFGTQTKASLGVKTVTDDGIK